MVARTMASSHPSIPPRRSAASGWREAARSLGPTGLALPLAAFMAVFAWDGGRQAAAGVASLPEPASAKAHRPALSAAGLDAAQPALGAVRPTSRRAAAAGDRESARFGACRGRGGFSCTIDGDSLNYQGRQIRIADIDTPEIGHPKCPGERQLGEAAETRLRALLNAGPFTLEPADRARDRYGRELWTITRAGHSLGATLIDEGLAHPWVGHKLPWC
jgi:micrococcal nuclease